MSFFYLGNGFKSWVNLFYNSSTACVCNYGHSSGFFKIERGVRQGCPLSPYLFILCVEVLSMHVITNRIIKGIFIGHNQAKILQYADDTVLFLDKSETTLCEAIRLLKDFSLASGLTISMSKSDLFPLGPFITNTPFFLTKLNIKVTHGPVRFLGIYFNHDGNDLFRLNYIQKLSRLKSCLRLWSSRDVTPIGRITLVKSLALSQLVSLFLVLPDPPVSFIKDLESMIFVFIWQGNPDKVKRSVLINDIQKGGLKAIHIKSFINSLNCTWVRRHCDNSKGLWKIFFDLELTKYGKDFLFYCNCSSQDVRIKNVFVRQVVHAWSDATFCIPISP